MPESEGHLNITPDLDTAILIGSPAEVIASLSDLTLRPLANPRQAKMPPSQKFQMFPTVPNGLPPGVIGYVAGMRKARPQASPESSLTYARNVFVGAPTRHLTSVYAVLPAQFEPIDPSARDLELLLMIIAIQYLGFVGEDLDATGDYEGFMRPPAILDVNTTQPWAPVTSFSDLATYRNLNHSQLQRLADLAASATFTQYLYREAVEMGLRWTHARLAAWWECTVKFVAFEFANKHKLTHPEHGPEITIELSHVLPAEPPACLDSPVCSSVLREHMERLFPGKFVTSREVDLKLNF